MPRESLDAKRQRTARIIDSLRRTYPEAHCELNYSNPLELLVATILSAQSTDKQVNIVTQRLFKKYRSVQDFAQASPAELENDIRSLGFFRNKTKSIQNCCRALVDQYQGQVPATMEALTGLAGVGRKTANVVLGNAFNLNEGVVVDTHVTRLSQRLGLTRQNHPEKIEQDLIKLVAQPDWTNFSHWLIWHGRRRCSARRPDCAHCEIRQVCPTCPKNL